MNQIQAKYHFEKFKDNLQKLYKATEKNSIICQSDNLLTFPAIKEKIESKQILIHG